MSIMKTFTLSFSDLQHVGEGLCRPENVLAFRDGTLLTSSNQGYLTRIAADGTQTKIGNIPGGQPTSMAIDADGSILTNNTADGKLYRIWPDGRHEMVLDEIEGQPIGSINYVLRDRKGRIWLAVSSRRTPPFAEFLVKPDGYIVLIDQHGPRIVADGIKFPNEIKLDAEEQYAYIPETYGRRVLRYRITDGGDLVEREVFGPDPLGETAFPDGLTLDAEGNVWVAIVSRNGLMIINPDGQAHTVFEDPNVPALEEMGRAYATGSVAMGVFGACVGQTLKFPTSIAFGGPDLKTVYMGSLGMPYLLSFESPVPGLPLQHHR